jgi:hypothetical protein
LKDAYPVWAGGHWKRTRQNGHLAGGLPVLNASTGLDGQMAYVDGAAPLVLVSLMSDGRRLLIEVLDQAAGAPLVRPASADAESGRGLRMIDELADGVWGWNPVGETGKCVWAEIGPGGQTRRLPA